MRDDLLIRLRRRLGRARGGEDGSALVMVLVFMVILVAMAASLISVIQVNANVTLQSKDRGKSVYTAEAGLQSALGMLRAAALTSDPNYGDASKLPCTVKGSVDGSSASEDQYAVTIYYGINDPSTHSTDTAWLSSTNTDPSSGFGRIACGTPSTPNYGLAGTPYYALIESSGTTSGSGDGRTLLAVYHFDISLAHDTKRGGLIYAIGKQPTKNADGTTNYSNAVCLRAEDDTAGSLIRYVSGSACNRDASSTPELLGWIYDNPSQELKLASTSDASEPDAGLCVAGPVSYGTAIAPQTVTKYYVYIKPGTTEYGIEITDPTAQARLEATGQPGTITTSGSRRTSSPALRWQEGFSTKYASFIGTTTSGSSTPGAGTVTDTTVSANGVTTETWEHTYAANSIRYYASSGSTTSANPATSTFKTYRWTKVSTTTQVLVNGQVLKVNSKPVAALVNCSDDTGTYVSGGTSYVMLASQASMLWGFEEWSSWFNSSTGTPYCLYNGGNAPNSAVSPDNLNRSSTSTTAASGQYLSVYSSAKSTDFSDSNRPDVTCGGTYGQSGWAFDPEPKVGAGAAGATMSMLVNFAQFGRCGDWHGASTYTIAFPCKQDPNFHPGDPSGAVYNQRWSYDEPIDPQYVGTTRISMTDSSGNTECLAPNAATSTYGGKQYALVQFSTANCSNSRSLWTRQTWTGHVETSYIFINTVTKQCLQTDPVLTSNAIDSTYQSFGTLSVLTTTFCNGSAVQKWNAPADLPLEVGLGDYQEIPSQPDAE